MKVKMMFISGQLYKIYWARICEEMPGIKLRQKAWFLHKSLDDGWEYLGYFVTLKAAKRYIEQS